MPIETWVQIATLSLIILVPFMLWRRQPSKWAVIGCVVYAASYGITNIFHIAFWALDPPLAYGFALRLYQASTLLLVALYAGILFYALMSGVRADFQAKLVWLVLFVAEAFAVLEYAECKMLVDPFGSGDLLLAQAWGIDVSRYACGRVFGSVTPYAAPIITSLYLIWINARSGRPHGS